MHTQQPSYLVELVHVSEPTRLLRSADRLLLDQLGLTLQLHLERFL